MFKASPFFLKDLKRRIGAKIMDTRYVLQLRDPETLDRRHFPGETVHLMESFAEVTAPLRDELRRVFGPDGLDGIERFFGEHGRLCVLTVEGRFGSMSWVRSGNHIPRWPIPLTARDRVTGRAFTDPAFRGRGMHGRCVTALFDRVVQPGNRFLADCHVWNDAAIRQFTRTGFEIIARGRPKAHSRLDGARELGSTVVASGEAAYQPSGAF